MSDNRKDGKGPPKDTRFRPGQSGNPKGRPRTAPRAEIPSQLGRDIRAVGRRKTTINTPEGPRRMSLFEAYVFRIWMDAISGKVSQQKLLLKLIENAYFENFFTVAGLQNYDRLARDFASFGGDDGAMRALLNGLSTRSKRW